MTVATETVDEGHSTTTATGAAAEAGRDLLELSLPDLMARARVVRDEAHGNRVTYSPKSFIPLTMLCQDRCGYCTFAQPPARLESPYLSEHEVLAIAESAAAANCHEALFTLGERPELRYPDAAEWLEAHGFASTVDYLAHAARLVVDKTGLLPHINAGALSLEELALLRTAAPSQGMMLETLAELDCHRGSPDKTPERRLATLDAAGELAIPFTTGILVGIGETRADRVDALEAIAESHRHWGHVQEVIVQNFLPKPGTAMHTNPACDYDEHLEAIALARLILPAEIHIQAPPNLSDDFGVLLDAGIDDWGGVSPITIDHVNPERPWPDIDRLREVTEARGFVLAPRLTVYPEYALDPQRWLDDDMRFPVLDHSDAEGLGRTDDGGWYSGADVPPPMPLAEQAEQAEQSGQAEQSEQSEQAGLAEQSGQAEQSEQSEQAGLAEQSEQAEQSGQSEQAELAAVAAPCGFAATKSAVGEVIAGVRDGREVGVDEIVTLFGARGSEVGAVARLADDLRRSAVGDDVTWVSNRNINYTNVCTFKCRFCGFSKGPLSLNLRGDPYLLSLDDIADRAVEAAEAGATEVCLQGGIHPNFDGDYYIDVTRAVKDAVPGIHVHGFTALEVTEGARRLEEPLSDYLGRLMDAGLRSLPGTAAEILDDEIRAVICPDKIDTDQWLEAHRTAHELGLASNVTIMFGTVEQPVHWARHLVRTRELQKRTGGFTEFVPLPFVHMAAPIYLQRRSRRGPTFREALLMHAVGRIAYHGWIPNIQASWVKLGLPGAARMLQAGANDLGGTLIDENISRAAGASHGQQVTEDDLRALCTPLGRSLRQRTTLYDPVPA